MTATPTARTTTRKPASAGTARRRPGVRELAAQATREAILRAATKVFAKYGYDGGSVEKISKAAKSYDRMIYYYFGSKEGLFIAVLEETYRRFNDAESALALDADGGSPLEALDAVVRFVVSYYRRNPEFVTLLNTENLHRGKHIAKSLRASEYSLQAVGIIERVLQKGVASGAFRVQISARDLYLMIAALGYFYQSNRFTLSAFLGEELESAQQQEHWESFVLDTVRRTVAAG